jgi:hypothetical protein
MQVAQLLDALFGTAHIEVVEALLLDGTRTDAAMVKQLGESLFDDFHYDARIPHIRSVIKR